MSIMLENKQGLLAGDGNLPVEMARHAKENGFENILYSRDTAGIIRIVSAEKKQED